MQERFRLGTFGLGLHHLFLLDRGFLTMPGEALTPDPRSWRFRVAELVLAIHTRDPRIAPPLEGPSLAFFDASPQSAELKLQLEAGWDLFTTPQDARVLARSGGLWTLFEKDRRLYIELTSPALGPEPYKRACLDLDQLTGQISLSSSALGQQTHVDPLEYPLDELLVASAIGRLPGIELHAAAIAPPEGPAALFVGQSGRGKSTTAGLWKDALPSSRVLSDDRVIARPGRPTPRLYGTPWHGEAQFADPVWAPLGAIFFLEHGPRTRLIDLSRAEASARLLVSTFAVFHDPELTDRALRVASELTEAVPCFRLSFTKDRSAVDIVQSCLRSASAAAHP